MPILKDSETKGYKPVYEKPVTVISIGGKKVEKVSTGGGSTTYVASQTPPETKVEQTTEPVQKLSTPPSASLVAPRSGVVYDVTTDTQKQLSYEQRLAINKQQANTSPLNILKRTGSVISNKYEDVKNKFTGFIGRNPSSPPAVIAAGVSKARIGLTKAESKVTESLKFKSSQEIGIDKRINNLNKIADKRELNDQEITTYNNLLIRKEAIQKSFEQTPAAFGSAVAIGVVTAPIVAAKTIVSPIKTTKETIEGVVNLPSSFIKNPLSTTGSVVGSLIAFELLGRAVRLPERINKVEVKTGIKPKADVSIQFSDAVKIGENKYLVSSKIKTKIIDPKTGKILDTIDTTGKSFVVAAETEGGAVKAVSDSVATSINKYGSRYYPKESKVTKKYNVQTAKGEITLTPTETEGTYKGVAETRVVDEGTLRLRQNQIEKAFKKTETRTPTTSTVMSNIKTKKLSQKQSTRNIAPGIKVEGTETAFQNLILSDVYRENLKVKGYTKKTGNKIPSYLRKERVDVKSPIKFRDLSSGIGRSFEPAGVKINLDQAVNIGKSNVQIKIQNKQVQAAVVASQAQIDAIVQSTIKQKTKPIIKTQTKNIKTEQLLKNTKTNYAISPAAIQKERAKIQKMQIKQSSNVKQAQKMETQIKQMDKDYIDLVFNVKSAETQKTGQIQAERQSSGLRQPQREQQLLKEVQQLSNPVIIPTIPLVRTPYVPKPIIPKVPPPFFFKLPAQQPGAGFRIPKQLKYKSPKRIPNYAASLGAAAFQVKPFKISKSQYAKLKRKVFSGAEARPLVQITDKDIKKFIKKKKAVQF